MEDLIERARRFATEAHRRIDHRRKYSHQPYEVHLAAVADLVASVTDDAEMIAAAWLHDTVEDTPATIQDIESAFGRGVAELVESLTDVSTSSDGNRAARKAIDREHTAAGSVRAKTVKLADLIDNCSDISKHDPTFARTFLDEMAALLDILSDANPTLYQRARKTHARCLARVQSKIDRGDEDVSAPALVPLLGLGQRHVLRLFVEAFTAKEICTPLRSFDGERSASTVRQLMDNADADVAGVRDDGIVIAYLRPDDLGDGTGGEACGTRARRFATGQVVDDDAPLSDVIQVLTRHEHCFVRLLGEVGAVIGRGQINSPVVRMWLFGIITIIEMTITQRIRDTYPGDAWQNVISEGRLAKARELLEERHRRNQPCDLLDCLQLSDKGQIAISDPTILQWAGVSTKRSARQRVKDLESLRNDLAHGQDIVTHNWVQIARMSHRVEDILGIAHAEGDTE